MISEFMQFGYLGLLGMLIYLCYQIIEKSKANGRSFKETIIILSFFSVLSLIGGSVGYAWASKQLEVEKTKENTATILQQEIEAIRLSHLKSMEPLQTALENSTKSLTESVINRNQYVSEITEINTVIQMREKLYISELETLKGTFEKK